MLVNLLAAEPLLGKRLEQLFEELTHNSKACSPV